MNDNKNGIELHEEIISKDFQKILNLINDSRTKALKQINSSMVVLYWNIGKYLSNKVRIENWGKSVIKELADFIKTNDPKIKGFTDKNLWRMKQFYETYLDKEKLATLWRQISWSNNRRIMSLKSEEEREFYLVLCSKKNYSYRELERFINSGTFERTILGNNLLSDKIMSLPQNSINVFKDSYIFEFLNLPTPYIEKDLQNALTNSLKKFILELGFGFTFIGQEYRIQVGNDDFYIDLLFYHRELQCLVAIELKTTKFQPSNLGQLEFYLEALDRDVKLPHENPSIGILLCREKNDEVVEYALSRSVSPTVIAEYETKLIPKNVLREKLNEFYNLLEENDCINGL